MKVSVITPSFNRARFLRKNLDSVMGQKYPDLEHIVIDGGSSDDTLSILKEYEGRYNIKYVSRTDRGMYYAINDGIGMASGEIVAYLNTDDFYFSWSVTRAVEEFERNTELDMVYGDSLVQDVRIGQEFLNIYASHRRYWLKHGGILCQPTVFLRRRVFEKIGQFNVDYKYLADCEFWQRLNRSGLKIRKIDEFLAIESNHEGTLREKHQEAVEVERAKLDPTKQGGLIAFLRRGVFQLLSYFEKDIKILHFSLHSANLCRRKCSRWGCFLNVYRIRFHFLNYILCKIYHDRTKYPRFTLTKKTDL